MSTDQTARSRRTPIWLGVVASTVIAAIALIAIWRLTVPANEICIAIYPAPPGCAAEARMTPAILWTVLTAIAYLAAVIGTLTIAKTRTWVPAVGVLLVAAAGIAGYALTLYA